MSLAGEKDDRNVRRMQVNKTTHKRQPIRFVAVVMGVLATLPIGVAAQPTVYSVGVCGTFTNIQDAIDAAVVGSETEVRVQGEATYLEALHFPKAFAAGSIRVTGGWDCTFSTVDGEPEATVVDAGGAGSAARIRIGGGSLYLGGLTLTGGQAEKGAGAQILLDGDAAVVLEHLRVVENTATSAGSIFGGGISADLDGFESLEIRDVTLYDNQAISDGQAAVYGGGVAIVGSDSASFLIEDCHVSGNRISSFAGNVLGGGVHLETLHSAQGQMTDCTILDNVAAGDLEIATGVHVKSSQSSELAVERTLLVGNHSDGVGAGPQVRVSAHNISTLWVRDSGIVKGDYRGLYARPIDGAQVHLTNLTVADHPDTGLVVTPYELGEASVYNSLVFGNAVEADINPAVDIGSNLIGVDPLFVDPVNLDYHLQTGSPVIDAGDNDPPGGLGEKDLDGAQRIMDDIVDIGMYETPGAFFQDGFETGDCTKWSLEIP